MFNKKTKQKGAAAKAPASPVEPVVEPIEREILREFAKQRAEARQRVTAIEAEVERLEMVVAEGSKVAATLQDDIAGDGAASIAALVTGAAKPDEKMSSLVAIEMAARAATIRLPHAKAALEDAKAARQRAEVETMKAARNVLVVEAEKRAAEYRAHFAALGRLHDELVGCSYGVPPSERLGQEIANSVVGFEVPNFNLGAGSYAVTMRHTPDERLVAKSTAAWTAAREALLADPDADIAKVLAEKHEPIAAIGSAPPGVVRGTNPAAAEGRGDGVPVNGYGLPVSPYFRF